MTFLATATHGGMLMCSRLTPVTGGPTKDLYKGRSNPICVCTIKQLLCVVTQSIIFDIFDKEFTNFN